VIELLPAEFPAYSTYAPRLVLERARAKGGVL